MRNSPMAVAGLLLLALILALGYMGYLYIESKIKAQLGDTTTTENDNLIMEFMEKEAHRDFS